MFSGKALRSVPWMISAKLVTFIIYFVVSIIVVKALTPEDYGILALSKNFGQYMIIFCALGLNTCILRYLPEIEMKGDYLSIKSFIVRSFFCQIFSWIMCVSLIYLIKLHIFEYLTSTSELLLDFTCLWILAWVLKNTVTDSLTALFEAKTVALIAVIQSLIVCLSVIWVCSMNQVRLEYILAAELLALGLTFVCGLFKLKSCLNSSPNDSLSAAIPTKRVFKLASPVWFNGLLRSLMLQYTEIFVLAYCFLPEIAGFYELGYSLPLLAITFIPMALQTLFSSAFAEAYERNKALLPSMVNTMFKVLILLSVPLAITGFLFSETLVVKLYGEDMKSAGLVASYFSLIHILPLISMPLSMAVTTLEKNSKTVGLLILQVTVNISLDIILIPQFGLMGAVAAVLLTFILTIPIRLLVIKRLIGGLWFPIKFFFKVILCCILVTIPFSLMPDLNSTWAVFLMALIMYTTELIVLWRLDLLKPLIEIIRNKVQN